MAITENTYTGDGSTVLFPFTFEYIAKSDVKVSLNGTLTDAYSLVSETSSILFDTAPDIGVAIRIYRDTNIDTLSAEFFPGSAIRAEDLNNNFTQNLYVTQEVNNNAVQSDDSIPFRNDISMGGYKITNLANPVADTDAVNRAYVNNAVANVLPDGDKGDIVVSGSGNVFTIDNGAVTNAKVGTGIAPSKLDFTQSGTDFSRTVESKLKDVISVKDFGALGNGAKDDTDAIQAAIDAANAASGAVIHFPPGTYKTTASITLKSSITIEGSGRESTRITASGNYPILVHAGGPGNNVGNVTIRSIQIRGQANTNTKQFGVFCDWGGSWVIEDVSFRLCRIGYFQGTSRSHVIKNCDFQQCHTALWFGPIDQSGGGTPDNTVFMETLDTASTVDVCLRVEGLTGCKAVNCSFTTGNTGVYVGNYNRATTPRAILDGSTGNVPAEADARQIRWMHLTNIYTDSTPQQGWIITRVAPEKPTTEVKIVNCWAGNHDGTGIEISSCKNIQIVGSTILNTDGHGLTVAGTTGVQISNLQNSDFDKDDGGLSGIKLTSCDNIIINNVLGEAINSTVQSDIYMVELQNCQETSINGLINDGSRLVLVKDSTRTNIANCFCNAAAPPVVESGTSNSTTVCNVTGPQQPTLIGTNSTQVFAGTGTAPRFAISGGSPTQPAAYLRDYPTTGIYQAGPNALGVTADSVPRAEISSTRALLSSSLLTDAADDTAAAGAGVAIGQLYRTGSTIKLRIS